KDDSANAKSWEVSFARSCVPVQIQARSEPVAQPTLTYVKKTTINCAYLTRDEPAGIGEHAHLTENGMRLMQLLTWPESSLQPKTFRSDFCHPERKRGTSPKAVDYTS